MHLVLPFVFRLVGPEADLSSLFPGKVAPSEREDLWDINLTSSHFKGSARLNIISLELSVRPKSPLSSKIPRHNFIYEDFPRGNDWDTSICTERSIGWITIASSHSSSPCIWRSPVASRITTSWLLTDQVSGNEFSPRLVWWTPSVGRNSGRRMEC